MSRTRRRTMRIVLALLAAGFVGLNAVACRHAYRMLHYTSGGDRTASPERLSWRRRARVLLWGVNVPRPRNTTVPSDCGLAFRTVRLLGGSGLRIEAWHIPAESESQGVVVLFHGYSACKAGLLAHAEEFHRMGFDTLLVDFRGSGGTEGNATTMGYRETEEVTASVRQAREMAQGRAVILYGQSMGGAAILRAVHAYGIEPDAVIVESVFDSMLETIRHRFEAMGIPAFPSAHLLAFWGSVQCGCVSLRHDPADYARRVSCPALVLHGALDPRVTMPEASRLLQNLAGPRAFEVFERAGHAACLEADPARWRRAVGRVLGELQAGGPASQDP